MIQDRLLLSCKFETRLPDCGVIHYMSVDQNTEADSQFSLQRLLVSVRYRSCHIGFQDTSCSYGGL